MSIDNFSFTASNTGSTPTVTLSTQHPAAANINTGSTSNIIAIYEMVASNTTIVTTAMLFTTAGLYTNGGTDISKFTVYQNTIASLAGSPTSLNLQASVVNMGGNIQVLSGFLPIPSGTISYIIITADVASTGTVGDYVSIASSTAAYNFSFAGGATVAGVFPLSASNTFTIVSGSFSSDRLAVARVGNGASLTASAFPISILQFNTSGTSQSGTLIIPTMPITPG